jgi:phenylacetate-CoA ligase
MENPETMLTDWVLKIGSAMVGRRFTAALEEMQRAQWLPANVLQERTESRLSRLLRHAAENVPFYREAYRRLDFSPGQLQTVADLQQLPIVSKAIFRQHPIEQFLAVNVPAHRRLEWTTSGSTGEPFKFYLDREMMPIVYASHLFYDSWFSLNPFDRHVRIMAPPVAEPALPQNTPLTARLRYKVNSRLQAAYEANTQRRFSMFDLNEARAKEIYECIEKFRPRYILGYTSTLSSVADDLLRRNLRLSRPLSGVMTIAETLTPHRRQLIERYFGAPIINRYGLREFKFWCAQSCSESPDMFHVNTELVTWEIVRQDGTLASPGELGRVVLTNLHNYAMPFIRYDTGDLAVAGTKSCVCGRGFPLVDQLEGRSTECVLTPSGKMINPVSLGQYLFVSLDYVDAIRQYQLVVERPNQMRLLVVPSAIFTSETRARLQRHMAELVGEDVSLEVEIVEEIPLEKSGKRPIIKSSR